MISGCESRFFRKKIRAGFRLFYWYRYLASFIEVLRETLINRGEMYSRDKTSLKVKRIIPRRRNIKIRENLVNSVCFKQVDQIVRLHWRLVSKRAVHTCLRNSVLLSRPINFQKWKRLSGSHNSYAKGEICCSRITCSCEYEIPFNQIHTNYATKLLKINRQTR